jgi:NNP family nitrate/nitrite transporter-like MFS transporter
MGGVVGGSGNLGGIIFSTIARFVSTPQTVWIIGIFGISIGSLISFINPSVSKRLSPHATLVN